MKTIKIDSHGNRVVEDDGQPDPVGSLVWPREFMQRFTNAEIVAIQTSVNPGVIIARTHLQTSVGQIDTSLDETHILIGALVQAGVLTPERMVEVLA